MSKPTIPQAEVERAQAVARHHEGVKAREQGYDPAALRSLATYGKPTEIGGEPPLVLLPQTLQVQLCLVEHSKLFPHSEGLTVADCMGRLTHLALIYGDPDLAFELLTAEGEEQDKRRTFTREAFRLASYFDSPEAINKLTAHITVQMQLTDEASGGASAKKPPARKALGGRRR
jgi:hypothetical protein